MLRIRLSNGKYLKYEGHQMFPDNYTKLRGYLNRYVGKYVNKFEEEYRKYSYWLIISHFCGMISLQGVQMVTKIIDNKNNGMQKRYFEYILQA